MRLRTKILLPLLSTVLFATSASAAIILPPTQTTLQALVAGDSYRVGDKLFTDWGVGTNIVLNDISGRNSVDLSDILVTGDNADPSNPGLKFDVTNGALTLQQSGSDGGLLGLFVYFKLTVDNLVESWKDIELVTTFIENGPTNVGDPDNRDAHVHEFLYDLDPNSQPTPPTFSELDTFIDCDSSVQANCVLQSGLGTTVVFTPRASGWIVKDIDLATELFGETVGITSFEQNFSQVPEPSTLAIFGLGLMGLASRRLKKAKLN